MNKIKYLIAGLAVAGAAAFFTGCGNYQIIGITYNFNYAEVIKPDGTIIKGKVDSWKDYENSMVQVVINGNTYYTHGSKVLLMVKK